MTRQKPSIFDRSREDVWDLGEREILAGIDRAIAELAPERRQLLELLRYRMFSATPSMMVVSKLSSHAMRLLKSGRVLLVETEELAVEWLNQSSAPPGSLRPERALETIKKMKGKR